MKLILMNNNLMKNVSNISSKDEYFERFSQSIRSVFYYPKISYYWIPIFYLVSLLNYTPWRFHMSRCGNLYGQWGLRSCFFVGQIILIRRNIIRFGTMKDHSQGKSCLNCRLYRTSWSAVVKLYCISTYDWWMPWEPCLRIIFILMTILTLTGTLILNYFQFLEELL